LNPLVPILDIFIKPLFDQDNDDDNDNNNNTVEEVDDKDDEVPKSTKRGICLTCGQFPNLKDGEEEEEEERERRYRRDI
jgi:hypothetical protein